MVKDLITPFLLAATNVIETMAFTKVDAQPAEIKSEGVTFGEVTGLIGMTSEQFSGNLMISFDESAILGLVSRMLSEEIAQIDAPVVDAVGEITNMICGGAKALLREQGVIFDMATPTMIVGKGVTVTQLSKVPITSIPFITPDGRFVVEACLRERSPK